jgi:hypothetical protein
MLKPLYYRFVYINGNERYTAHFCCCFCIKDAIWSFASSEQHVRDGKFIVEVETPFYG